MPRLKLNRWWPFILVLCLSLVSVAVTASAVHAQTGGLVIDDPAGGGGNNNSYGDPDVPTGAARPGANHGVMYGEVRTVGDGGEQRVARMWRLQIVLQALRDFYFRY